MASSSVVAALTRHIAIIANNAPSTPQSMAIYVDLSQLQTELVHDTHRLLSNQTIGDVLKRFNCQQLIDVKCVMVKHSLEK
jgi:hypothetical protein